MNHSKEKWLTSLKPKVSFTSITDKLIIAVNILKVLESFLTLNFFLKSNKLRDLKKLKRSEDKRILNESKKKKKKGK